jgi:hypothetical protein
MDGPTSLPIEKSYLSPMRNSIKLLGLAALALGAFTSNATAQNYDQNDNLTRFEGGCSSCSSASATTTVWAYVITPITLTATEEMNFGAFCVNPAGGTATIKPDISQNSGQGGTISYVNLQPINTPLGNANDGDGPEEARFHAQGEPGLGYSINVTGGFLTGTGVSLGAFTVHGLHVAQQNVPASAVFPLAPPSDRGKADINVGATLTAASTASLGLHGGLITMTVAY